MKLYSCVAAGICLLLLTLPCLAEPVEDTTESPQPQAQAEAAEANEAALSFPYVAAITGNRVNVRSGPGTNYYSCARLDKDERVVVVGSRYSWAQIVPPAGSFSWISKQYISIDPKEATIGTVTGFNVRVYAGSQDLQPMHSTSLQLKHNKDEKVRLLGEEKDGYYKIEPPAGAYLWVLGTYIQPLGPVGEVALVEEPAAGPDTSTPKEKSPAAAPAVSIDTLGEYYTLQKKFEAERTKPLQQQNYEQIKNALSKITDDKRNDKAARYARLTLGQVERCELAIEVAAKVTLQQIQLEATMKRIEKARQAKLEKIEDLGKYAAVGRLQTSSIYGSDPHTSFWRIVDDAGNTVCYAQPTGKLTDENLGSYANSKVGLIGTIKPHPQTGNALVRFTEIVQLK